MKKKKNKKTKTKTQNKQKILNMLVRQHVDFIFIQQIQMSRIIIYLLSTLYLSNY